MRTVVYTTARGENANKSTIGLSNKYALLNPHMQALFNHFINSACYQIMNRKLINSMSITSF